MPTTTELARVRLARGLELALEAPGVMGVLNVTPDSFSDGGRHLADPVGAGLRLVEEGAVVLDVGGESTRPGAAPVPLDEERRRVLPVIEGLVRAGCPAPISVDTRKAALAREALAAGAALVNDVSGLSDPDLAGVVAAAGAGLVLGHIQGTPETMQAAPRYVDVVGEVEAWLAARRAAAVAAGVDPAAVLLDPGIGFGKALEHNLALLAALPRLAAHGPLVVGLSRKAMLGALLGGRPVEGRLFGGLGGAVVAACRGAALVRTHDVAATVDALRVAWAIAGADDRAPGTGGGRP